jgi:hypothetical protein
VTRCALCQSRVNRTVQCLLRRCSAMSRMSRDGVLSVFGVFSRLMNNKYTERMGRRRFLKLLVAYFRIAK